MSFKWVKHEALCPEGETSYKHSHSHHAAAVVGHLVYVFGGVNHGTRTTAPFQRLDYSLFTWLPVSSNTTYPYSRNGSTLTLVDDCLTVVGGIATGRPMGIPRVLIYDIPLKSWTLSNRNDRIFPLLANHSANLSSKKDGIVVFGGSSDGHKFNDTWWLSLQTWEVTKLKAKGTLPSPRSLHGSCLVGKQLYIFGGSDTAYRALKDMHILSLDLFNPTWSMPMIVPVELRRTPRCVHLMKMFPYEDAILIHDGWNLLAYNLITKAFENDSSTLRKRVFSRDPRTSYHQMVLINRTEPLIIGGTSQRFDWLYSICFLPPEERID